MLIKTRFKIIGAAEAAANLLCEFKIAEKKDDKQTNIKKGNVILVKLMASSIFSLFSTNPGAISPTNTGMKISTIKTIKNKLKNNKLKTSLANLLEFEFFFDS